jgi:uncharacterized membrane protein YccC
MPLGLTKSSANIRLALKTALAGCIAMFFADLLRLPQPYWAAISAMIVMQANLGATLATLARQNAEFHAHGRYEPARWSARRITLVKLLRHEERMSQAVETLDIACDGSFCGGIDPQWEPEFSALCAGISAALQRIAEAIATRKSSTSEYDFAAAINALDAKTNAARISGTPVALAAQTLEGVLRSHTIYFALDTLARELAAAQITARELVPASSIIPEVE